MASEAATPIVVCGAAGRMGRLLVQLTAAEPRAHLVVNHEPGCPIAYDPATDRFIRWCDCAFGLHLPTRVLGAKAAA